MRKRGRKGHKVFLGRLAQQAPRALPAHKVYKGPSGLPVRKALSARKDLKVLLGLPAVRRALPVQLVPKAPPVQLVPKVRWQHHGNGSAVTYPGACDARWYLFVRRDVHRDRLSQR